MLILGSDNIPFVSPIIFLQRRPTLLPRTDSHYQSDVHKVESSNLGSPLGPSTEASPGSTVLSLLSYLA